MGPGGPTSACLPCGTALGATWNPEVVEAVGGVIGAEARAKGTRVLLAPTVNMHRSPLAGRNFECYSEDPLLSGKLAAAYVRGAQAEGVATTVKHLVGNDAETERYTMSSDIDERALRELYLRPFELAVTEGGSLGVMTSYNRVNGRWCTEQPELLEGILRDEWGFDGFVVTDWFGVTGTAASAGRRCRPGDAGTGPGVRPRARRRGAGRRGRREAGGRPGHPTAVGVRAPRRAGRRRARRGRVGRRARSSGGGPPGRHRVDGAAGQRRAAAPRPRRAADRGRDRPQRRPGPDHGRRLGRAAGVVPGDPARGAAGRARRRGNRGPRARLRQPHATSRCSAAPAPRRPARVGPAWPSTGSPTPGSRASRSTTRTPPPPTLVAFEPPVPGLVPGGWSLRAPHGDHADRDRAPRVHADPGRPGPADRRRADGARRVRRTRRPGARRSSGWAASRSAPASTWRPAAPSRWSSSSPPARAATPAGCASAGRSPEPADLMDRAVAAAAAADVAVVVVGTTGEWESEGHDRDVDGPARPPGRAGAPGHGRQPRHRGGGQRRRARSRWTGRRRPGPCCRSGSAARRWPAALAEVLLGDAEPAGRLPTTLPERLEHNPSYGNFPGEAGARPLRRGRAGRLPLVRGPAAAGAVPVRPRRLVHHVVVGRGDAVVAGVPARASRWSCWCR